MSDYILVNGELYHYGVKGMKWGVRRYQNADGSLTAKGVKKYAKKQYAKESLNSNKTALGKAYDRYTGTHKINADMKLQRSPRAQNEAAAKKYLKDKNRPTREKAAKAVVKGSVKAAKVLGKIGSAYCYDQFLFGGAGTRAVKATVKHTGRAAVSAWVYANGGRDIRWYDK